MTTPLVDISSISKAFGTTAALTDISAIIPKGELVGLVGPDGAGKTTLMRLIAGLLLPTKGSIKVCGFDTQRETKDIANCIGYMPQKFGLYEDLTVLQNLNLYADIQGVIGKQKEIEFKRLLEFTRLGPFTDRLAGALSGGMKQKLGLACTLIRKPQLLLLDEPSVGVDPLSRRELWTMVQNLLQEDISVLWSTAYLDEAQKCKTILLLDEGKLLFHGPSEAMTKRVFGRTYLVQSASQNKRKLLEDILGDPQVIDATIQGKDIRVVLKSQESTLNALKLTPTPPRFEDAFIDILGGSPKEPSHLAAKFTQSTTTEILVESDKLTKRFGSFTAAQDISFKIESGEIFGLLGPNGAGKSTTFKMLCGLLVPTSGKASVNHVDLQKAPGEARSHIGYMAQKFSLYGDLSVKQNLTFFSGVYNLNSTAQKEAIDEMVETFHLGPYLSQSANELPLGFKQRLALSCAVMHRPKVLFLDEPTSGVDPLTRREFWTHINGLVQKGMTIMVTTHFMDEAEYCDRIALIYKGKTISLGTPDYLKEQAQNELNPSPTLEDAFIRLIEEYDARDL